MSVLTFRFLEIPELSYGDTSGRRANVLIEGENLHVLAALPQERIDFIYIDPPYHTGKRFRYDDRWSSRATDPEGDSYVTEADAGRHTAWLNFMACRLRLMKQQLKPSGVIAISIGKEELFRLGLLMDDLFGEKNRLGIINWQKRYGPANDSRHLSDTTEYVLVYAKDRYVSRRWPSSFPDPVLGLWGADLPEFNQNHLKIGDIPMTAFPSSWYREPFLLGCQSWTYEQSGHNQDAKKLLNAIMGAHHRFETPKPLKLIRKLVQLWCPPDGLVLDAFAGSGTTGHAVLELNAEVRSHRRFILIEQGNPKEQDAFARALTAERLKRVITGAWADGKHPSLSGGYVFQCMEGGWGFPS